MHVKSAKVRATVASLKTTLLQCHKALKRLTHNNNENG